MGTIRVWSRWQRVALCALLCLVGRSTVRAADSRPDSTTIQINTTGTDVRFVWKLEPALALAGLSVYNRTVTGETYQYYFHWVKPGTEKDFWSPENKWQGTGTLMAERASDSTWTVEAALLFSPNYLSLDDLDKELRRLLRAELTAAFGLKEREKK